MSDNALEENTVAAPLSPAALERLANLHHLGPLQLPDGCRELASTHGRPDSPEHIRLQLAIDDSDRIRAVGFTTRATGVILLAYDIMAELCLGVTLRQAAYITPLQVKRKIAQRFKQSDCRLPWDEAIPFPILTKIANHEVPPQRNEDVTDRGPRFSDLGLFEKVRRIETILDDNVRPMLATDGGGIELVDLRGDELLVHYQGACGSCSSSIGGTLKFIEETLNDALDTDLLITPEGLDESAFIV